MEIPNKVKNFVWRTCREALPTKANLSRQRIVPDGVCDRCKRHSEDNSHALFFCSDVQVVWASDPNWQWLLAMQGQTAREIFMRALEEDKDATPLAFTSQAIQNRRNQIWVGQTACPLNQILNISKERKTEFQLLHPSNLKQQHKKHTRWKPPAEDNLKVDYDGTIFQEQGRVGIGVVIHNSTSEVMVSLSQQIHLPTMVAQVEAMAARRAVEFAQGARHYSSHYRGQFKIHLQRPLKPESLFSPSWTLDSGCTRSSFLFYKHQLFPCLSSRKHCSSQFGQEGNFEPKFKCLDGRCTTRYSSICTG